MQYVASNVCNDEFVVMCFPHRLTLDVIVQSASIMRYIGKLSGLYPECPIKAALVDTIIDEEIDMTRGLAVSRYRGL